MPEVPKVVDVNARVTGFLLGTEDSDTQCFVERVLLALLKSGPQACLYGEFFNINRVENQELVAIQGFLPFRLSKDGWKQQEKRD